MGLFEMELPNNCKAKSYTHCEHAMLDERAVVAIKSLSLDSNYIKERINHG